MEIQDFEDNELMTFIVLAKYMIHTDGRVSQSELLDLMSLGEAIGLERFQRMLDASRDRHKDPHAVLAHVQAVTRYEARVLIFVLLEELGKGDGLGTPEQQMLAELKHRWEL